jgi:hypothetical protein
MTNFNDDDKRRISLYWLIIIICFMLMAVLLNSCKEIQYVTVPEVHTEYVYRDRVDSVKYHDSIYIKEVEKGDTIIRIEYRYKDRYIYKQMLDTIIRTDTIVKAVEVPVEVKVPRDYTFKDKVLFKFGGFGIFCLFLIILYVAYLTLKNKITRHK